MQPGDAEPIEMQRKTTLKAYLLSGKPSRNSRLSRGLPESCKGNAAEKPLH
jgi:hypothetical protein